MLSHIQSFVASIRVQINSPKKERMANLKRNPSLIPLFISIFFLIQLPKAFSNPEEFYQTCGDHSFSCGNITGIGYPFRGINDPPYCGYPGLILSCDEEDSIARIEIKNMNYRVLELYPATQTMRIAREDVLKATNCPTDLINTTLDYTLFDYTFSSENITFLYGCPLMSGQNLMSCGSFSNGVVVMPGALGPGRCNASVIYAVGKMGMGLGGTVNYTSLDQVLGQGFEVRWKVGDKACRRCSESGGRCGFGYLGSNGTACFCPVSPYVTTTNCSMGQVGSPLSPPFQGDGSSNNRTVTIVLPVVGAVVAGVGLGWFIFFCRQRRKRRLAVKSLPESQTESKELRTAHLASKAATTPSDTFTKSILSYPSSKSSGPEASYYGVQVFPYNELEEATDNFSQSRELGDGGFGTVYYGLLHDGRVVAVKRLYENNFKRIEQFMNEIEILTRLRHANLVTLYGCTSKRSRELLLVYEYIPNGTVADHLIGKRPKSGLLSWLIRLNIAIETADALAYLHASDIIHRDVKTNNILLDNDFHVKVADFGLSRLFPTDVTHVSTAPQGTPGYVDPEYYQCYQLTEKSDVYSFGVVLIELISSLQAVDTNRHRHDINLANMAINKIQNHALDELVDKSLGFATNSSTRRMIRQVSELAFRCLQQERDMRPSMQEVLDGLRKIQKEGLNGEKVDQAVEILIDDVGIAKDNVSPDSSI